LQHVFIRLTLQLAEHALPSQNSRFLFRFI
jgi:hypothetical protein